MALELKEEAWGTYQGAPVRLFTVKDNKSGFLASFSDLGASSIRVVVPDKSGTPGDVNLTQETPEDLINFGAMLGATVGRVANRIAGGKFSLDGADYSLAVNNGPNHLHGGKKGFDKYVWQLDNKTVSDTEVTLTFSLESPDMDEGYPGKLHLTAKYVVNPNKVAWEFEATTDKATLINITNHNYWNMDGIGVPIDPQEIHIASSQYNPVDEHGLNTGEFRNTTEIGTDKLTKFSDIFAKFGDVDNNFFIDGTSNVPNQRELHFAAEVYSPLTGRTMIVKTSEPCIQLYTANFLGAEPYQKTTNGNYPAKKHYALCLETQRTSNAIHQPKYRDTVILRPGQKYYHKTEHEFKLK